jgi:hypothetical protein
MSDPYVRETGRIEDMDGNVMAVSVNYDCVVLGDPDTGFVLTAAMCEEFASLFIAACWEAARNMPAG